MTGLAAEKAIRAAGLAPGDLTYIEGSKGPTGTVIAQDPEPGKSVAGGTRVAVTLAGPAPVPAPQLGGMDKTGAVAALSSAGLKLGTVVESYDPTVPAGVLVSQKPVPGVNTPKGSTVDLVVSKGPQPVAVPRVIGKSEADAKKALAAAGFKVKVLKKKDSAKKGTVIAQKPAGGKAQPGTSVQITVSTGAQQPGVVPPATDPSLLGTWKSSDGSRYTFRVGNRVKTPDGGVVRYRLHSGNLTIFHSAKPVTGLFTWDSANQFTWTINEVPTTFKRV